MSGEACKVLFLCTGNSTRSILAEAILNREGRGRFIGHSAGSHPAGRVHPLVLELLAARGHPTAGLHSKSWEVFAAERGLRMDLIVTVCDKAARETCPVWPGRPAGAHGPFPDPAAAGGSEAERRAVFAETYERIRGRVRDLVSLPVETLDEAGLRARLAAIGRNRPR